MKQFVISYVEAELVALGPVFNRVQESEIVVPDVEIIP